MSTYHLTKVSRNVKTGPIPVSTSSGDTCPPDCALKEACYGKQGPLSLHWAKVTRGEVGTDWQGFLNAIETLPKYTLWRMNQAGDLPGLGNIIDKEKLRQLVRANAHGKKRGFTYTHKPPAGDNAEAIRHANENGFTINLSGNSLSHADELADLAIGPVVAVVPRDYPGHGKTPAGRRVVVCPAQQKDSVTCSSCGACAKPNRTAIIAFRAHGTGAKKAELVSTTF